ncbi:phage portal protein [Thalassospira sp. TSL5-1]|uniref:phage portal protein n=1 Tax=Thalassospira sp. TSL5-1 TaxID=1544451 RepID=UPI0009F849AC|nr:phage portal protein [Thalassospira sp. TSL5-1]
MVNPFKFVGKGIERMFGDAPEPVRRTPTLHRVSRRSFSGARADRLMSDWVGEIGPLNDNLKNDLVKLRSNSRRLAMNNDYFKQFLRMVRRNVVGPSGIKLQNRCRDANGKLDIFANEVIENAWSDWGKKGVCTVCGKYSWFDVLCAVALNLPRDGEVLLREVRGFPNKFGYALQLIPADALDHRLTTGLANGSDILMGVERDKWLKPVAYHLKVKPSDRRAVRHERVPASEIIHLFVPEDVDQVRGLPWAHTAVRRLGMLGGYEEAALVAARAGASKMGFYQQREEGAGFAPGTDEQDEDGNFIDEAVPGHFDIVPAGYEFREYDPAYPNGEMPYFMKSVLRGASSGLGVSYNGLANDLEGVNFSSMRGGVQEERDEWMILQAWLIENLLGRVFPDFLEQSLLTGIIPLPVRKFDKFNAPFWFPRRWKWVDPDKDSKAAERDINLGVTSRTRVAADQGRDVRDVFEELAAEQKLADEMGVRLGDPLKQTDNTVDTEGDNASGN